MYYIHTLSDVFIRDENGIRRSEGPYGYIILGLGWIWDADAHQLRISDAVIVRVDAGLRICVSGGMYNDIYTYPFSEIYRKNGRYWFRGFPVFNYGMLNIPRTIDAVREMPEDIYWGPFRRSLVPGKGRIKYTVNAVCTGRYERFDREYRELYACVLSFDRTTGEMDGVGFDGLGKLQTASASSYEELRKKLLNDRVYRTGDEEVAARVSEYGFLNMYCENDGILYNSVWNGERPDFPRRNKRRTVLRQRKGLRRIHVQK